MWLTAESLGDADPILAAHPGLPAGFIFDAPLLGRLRLSGKRLVFLVECLADLQQRRTVGVAGATDPRRRRSGGRRHVRPVPGYRRLRRRLDLAAEHPWPWLRRLDGRSVASFCQWNRA